MNIEDIRNEAFTEDAKMETIADYLRSEAANPGLNTVLTNGDTAVQKTAKFRGTAEGNDGVNVSNSSISGQNTTDDGVADFQITSTGDLYLDFQPTDGTLSTFQIKLAGGTPVVVMSDDVKAAFKAELGIA